MVLVSSLSRAVAVPANERKRRSNVSSIGPASIAPAECASAPQGDSARK